MDFLKEVNRGLPSLMELNSRIITSAPFCHEGEAKGARRNMPD